MQDNVIELKPLKTSVDRKLVGVVPLYGDAIKPVHIAKGLLRVIDGRINKSKKIQQLALVVSNKGITPKNHDLETVYNQLVTENIVDSDISKEEFASFRNALQKLISADNAVYIVNTNSLDSHVSYSAGSKYFLTGHALYEEGGELIGSVIKNITPDLANYIKAILDQGKDPISLAFLPVLDNRNWQTYEGTDIDIIPAFSNDSLAMKRFKESMISSAITLKNNLKFYPNELNQLRIFNLYAIFNYFRYLIQLSSYYCSEPIHPILLDFSKLPPSRSSVARTSEITYTQVYKSLNRFYSWAFSEELVGYTREELISLPCPVYEKTKNPKKGNDSKIIWDIAKQSITDSTSEEEIRVLLGEAMYDIIAQEAMGTPLKYLKMLGTKSGILFPPDAQHPNKRFSVSQDVLEMLILSCVNPNEVISKTEIRKRLWERFNIIIGGSEFELEALQKGNAFLQIDENSLEENFDEFTKELEKMDFAELLADGILQIRTGDYSND